MLRTLKREEKIVLAIARVTLKQEVSYKLYSTLLQLSLLGRVSCLLPTRIPQHVLGMSSTKNFREAMQKFIRERMRNFLHGLPYTGFYYSNMPDSPAMQ